MSSQLEKVKELIELRAQARLGGGEKAIEKQHAKGKYTARERLAMLLDEGENTTRNKKNSEANKRLIEYIVYVIMFTYYHYNIKLIQIKYKKSTKWKEAD